MQSDFGAPIMCKDESSGVWSLHGILNKESNICKTNGIKHPLLYTSTSHYKSWINSVTGGV